MHHLGLNPRQHDAVTFPPSIPLQVLAGPGTGKTKVLCARTAELVNRYSIPPSTICAMTFTRKAAHEMQGRLSGSIGSRRSRELMLGTFHSIFRRFLLEHWRNDFLLWSDKPCKILLGYIIKHHLLKLDIPVNLPSTIQELIAKYKVHLHSESSLSDIYYESSLPFEFGTFKSIVMDYQSTLRISNAVDFEDIMLKSLEVILARPSTVAHIQHILVDEFQDTSLLQYELIHQLAKASGGTITVVGDGDQALYGWRFADPVNFRRMKTDFPNTHVIKLEENYRSTASILAVSQAIISQDNERPTKSLYTSQTPGGPLPYLKQQPSLMEEARFIATEIPRMIAASNGLLSYGDFALLFRSNWAMKDFANRLNPHGIPYRILPRYKHELYRRPEVKDVLAYLRLAVTPAFTPWLLRILRMMDGIEDEAVTAIVAGALKRNVTVFKMIEDGCKGIESEVDEDAREKLSQLVDLLKHLRKEIMQGTSPTDLIKQIIRAGRDHWTRNQWQKFSMSQSGIRRLLEDAQHFEMYNHNHASPTDAYLTYVDRRSRMKEESDSKVLNGRLFSFQEVFLDIYFSLKLVNLTWNSDPKIVMTGDYPSKHCDTPTQLNEERRVIYVGCTRAQTMLYLTYPGSEGKTGTEDDGKHPELSEFIRAVDPALFQNRPPELTEAELELFARILRRSKSEPA